MPTVIINIIRQRITILENAKIVHFSVQFPMSGILTLPIKYTNLEGDFLRFSVSIIYNIERK